jgi:hypothetical protein
MKIYKEREDGNSKGNIYVPFVLCAVLLIAGELVVIVAGIVVTVDGRTEAGMLTSNKRKLIYKKERKRKRKRKKGYYEPPTHLILAHWC